MAFDLVNALTELGKVPKSLLPAIADALNLLIKLAYWASFSFTRAPPARRPRPARARR